MNPDPTHVAARTHPHELRRQAEVGRRAAEFKTPYHRWRVELSLPRIELGAPTPAVRKLADA
jgi:hypothetical protein